jgi:hypothetical protein
MKNVHLIPTNKPSRLWTNNLRRRLELDEFPEQHPNNIAKHIYITSDEEIKEGDWFIREGSIHKCFKVHKTDIEFLTSIDSVYCGSNTFWSKEYCKKIILTTDQDLINCFCTCCGVQPIDDEFLEWFVKNPSCEEIEIVKIDTFKKTNEVYVDEITGGNYYEIIKHNKIIIPKEEPKQKYALVDTYSELDKMLADKPKQETLEEAAERLYPNKPFWIGSGDNARLYDEFKAQRDAFINGTKWQAERMYSEKEVEIILKSHKDFLLKELKGLSFFKDNNHWFEQFKKK